MPAISREEGTFFFLLAVLNVGLWSSACRLSQSLEMKNAVLV